MQKRILIVEDDDGLRTSYRRVLVDAGFETTEAADGTTALRLIAEQEQAPPDLVLLDLELPRFHGYVLHNELRHRHIPTLIATSAPDNLDHLAVVCVLRKPISAEQLVESVQQCLRSSD